MHQATFVLSTGRCGTQWLAQSLADAVGEQLRVEHEPLQSGYHARAMLGALEPAALGARAAQVTAHVADIARTLEAKGYLETGHPCWSSVPWLVRRFPGRVRVVHLVRHPVPMACSWLSHGAFVPSPLPNAPTKELISPFDPGVNLPEYRETWAALSPFEKCLVYWAEVNAFALKLECEGGVPWLRVRYEDLFNPGADALARLIAFLGLPTDVLNQIDRGETVDQHHFMLPRWPELERVAGHPRVGAVAAALGYDLAEFSAARLANRFLLPRRVS